MFREILRDNNSKGINQKQKAAESLDSNWLGLERFKAKSGKGRNLLAHDPG